MDINRVYENLRQLKSTDLAPQSKEEIMQAIVTATQNIGEDLSHYVVPKTLINLNGLDVEQDHIATIHVIAGVGIMGFVDRIRLHALDDVIIYEPDEGAAYLFLTQVNVSEFFRKSGVHLFTTLDAFIHGLRNRYEWWKNFEAWKSPPCAKHYPDKVEAFHHHLIQNGLIGKINQNTLNKLYFLWAANELTNLQMLKNRQCAMSDPDSMKNVPAVLVGAGPSLRHSLPELKKISQSNKMLIVAASTTLRVLIPEQIYPHIVIIIEGEQQSHFDNIPHLNRLRLLAHLQTHPEHLKHDFKDLFWFDQETSALRSLTASLVPGTKPIKFSGNVLSAAFLLTTFWGCNPIAFTGMDLAYQTGDKYMKGLEKKEEKDNERKFYPVPAQDESTLEAPPEFISYAHNLEMEIERVQKADPNFRAVNASTGGRRIKGTIEMTLEKFAGHFSMEKDLVEPMLSRAIESWPSLPEKTVETVLTEHLNTYHRLSALLESPNSPSENQAQIEKINHFLDQLPEFNTGVIRIIPWVRHIRSNRNISNADLDALRSTVRQILDGISSRP